MPFKFKLIKTIQKSVNSFSSQLSEEEQNPSTCFCPDEVNHQEGTNKPKKALIKAKVSNIYQLMLREAPLQQRHIVNFFNIVTINQEAIRTPDCQESFFRTLFFTKSVKKVVIKPRYLVMNLAERGLQLPPLRYTIERFKSFGHQGYYKLAVLMEEVASKIADLKEYDGKNQRQFNHDLAESYVQTLGNRLFFCKGDNKIFISKSLLEALQYNPQDFALEMAKYKASFHECCSVENYLEVMMKTLSNVGNLISLLTDRISLETFLNNSLMRWKDILYTKNNKKVFCRVKTGMPSPLVTIFEVEELNQLYQEFPLSPYFEGGRKKHMLDLRRRVHESQAGSLRKIVDLPPNYLQQNSCKMAGYIDKHSLQTSNIKLEYQPSRQ